MPQEGGMEDEGECFLKVTSVFGYPLPLGRRARKQGDEQRLAYIHSASGAIFEYGWLTSCTPLPVQLVESVF